ncbi:MAG: alpha-L-fucosidase [Terriglobia bacterium]
MTTSTLISAVRTRIGFALVASCLCIMAPVAAQTARPAKTGPYEPTTQSLRKHQVPQWYEDAKFGIFVHWGVFAVPAYHEWYVEFISPKANFGYMLGGPPYTATRGNLPEELYKANVVEDAVKYHLAHWGPNFAYDDFIPMFKAEKFDPAAWAQLFRDAGARYVVLTAKHGDEFALWPSKFTHRNAMDMGPRRDLAGDLLKAVRQSGLKMGFYHNTTYTFWDPRYPGRDWVDYMNNSIKELVDLYHPSILWGDVREGPIKDWQGRPLPADYWNSKEVLAYFYNHSEDPAEVVANDRWGLDTDGKMLGDFATPERTGVGGIVEKKWEECDSLDPTSWGYNRRTKDGEYMTPNGVVHYLVDVVSKNGNLLLNVGPRADGTIPEVMQSCLRRVGEWLRVNGEAIYGSRAWDTYRDGDVRFTRKGNTLYAIALEWPEEELRLTSLAGKEVQKVEMLGLNGPITWKQDGNGLIIQPPAKRPCRYAYTFKITCLNL